MFKFDLTSFQILLFKANFEKYVALKHFMLHDNCLTLSGILHLTNTAKYKYETGHGFDGGCLVLYSCGSLPDSQNLFLWLHFPLCPHWR